MTNGYTEAGALLRMVAAFGLPGARWVPPEEALEAQAWRWLLRLVRSQRVTGLLAAAVSAGAIPATDDQRSDVSAAAAEAAAAALELERTLLYVAGLLDDAGLDHRFLKGAAHAHILYDDPALRSFGDVDVLVRSEEFEGAAAILLAAGGAESMPELRPGFDTRFGKGRSFTLASGHEVDLHRALVAGPLGMAMEPGELFATSSSFALGGRTLPALGREELFLHACLHAAVGHPVPRLPSVRDVAQVLLAGEIDAGRVRKLAETWKLEAVVARAVRLAWETFALADAVPLSEWAAGYPTSEKERRVIDLYVGGGRSWGGQAVEALRLVAGPRAKAAYLRAMVFPDQDLLDALGRTRRDWWRRGARLLVRHGLGR